MQVGWVKICHFRQITRYTVKTVQDRRIVAIKNGYVSDDLGWPLSPQTTQIFAVFVASHIFVMGEHRDFKFGTQAEPRTNRPWKERGYVTLPILNFWPPFIFKEWLKLELSNLVHM